MWRGGGQRGKEDGGLVAVAVDADKNSQHALRWAADQLISRRQIFVLLHVRRTAGSQLPTSEVEEDGGSRFLEKIDARTKELLLPFQCFCSRRGLQCKEVILDEMDIPKAIVDFVVNQSVDKLVLGASSRNTLLRTFIKLDVPTAVFKAVPDFCSVYVISKGKISSTRPALHPNKQPTKQAQQFEKPRQPFQSVKSEPVAGQFCRSDPAILEVAGRSTVSVGTRTELVREHSLREQGSPGIYNSRSDGNSKLDQADSSF